MAPGLAEIDILSTACMFSLAVIRESVKIGPQRLGHDFVHAIKLALSQKYCNKVIIDVGLCIGVFDVLEAEDAYVHAGEAAAYVRVRFRLIVFKPFVGELLEGTVRNSTEEGILVSLGFFEDVLVPPSCMQPDTVFETAEQAWVWSYEGTKMYIDAGEVLRFRVMACQFAEKAPTQKDVLMAARVHALGGDGGAGVVEGPLSLTATPFKLVGSIAEDGLGLIRWWRPTADGQDEADAA